MQKQTNPALGKEGTTPLRVLVIDDSERHQKSARLTLADHDLTIVGTYEEAEKILLPAIYKAGGPKVEEEMERLGFSTDVKSYKDWEEFRKVQKEIAKKLFPTFDAVLCDLLMPVVHMSVLREQKNEEYAGEEMPFGFSLAFQAAKHGAKYVAVVTDTGHHDHPASAMLDPLSFKVQFTITGFHRHRGVTTGDRYGAAVGFYNSPKMVEVEGVCHACDGTGQRHDSEYKCPTCRGSGSARGKDWGCILKKLLAAGETA
ncbi:MAG: hypothetical protein OXU73_01585 [Candidatus Campbellbacteria bacterium]|nr:hypothetical protein [Candidatus Campbellbacteria bacterium]